ncbi:hypothetical protein HK100_012152 [Physocladia obscura]|uniref:S phase cyclin A-associated protein in the endoplasmic reticulum N-terminal domain-containing protein n=1 Tax=Physocladia obscura TaxID=109957 RepID=A0AAD5T8C8_9FUNG|nr:hypothetical protein HK100_012152 [Physocladia obscura]
MEEICTVAISPLDKLKNPLGLGLPHNQSSIFYSNIIETLDAIWIGQSFVGDSNNDVPPSSEWTLIHSNRRHNHHYHQQQHQQHRQSIPIHLPRDSQTLSKAPVRAHSISSIESASKLPAQQTPNIYPLVVSSAFESKKSYSAALSHVLPVLPCIVSSSEEFMSPICSGSLPNLVSDSVDAEFRQLSDISSTVEEQKSPYHPPLSTQEILVPATAVVFGNLSLNTISDSVDAEFRKFSDVSSDNNVPFTFSSYFPKHINSESAVIDDLELSSSFTLEIFERSLSELLKELKICKSTIMQQTVKKILQDALTELETVLNCDIPSLSSIPRNLWTSSSSLELNRESFWRTEPALVPTSSATSSLPPRTADHKYYMLGSKELPLWDRSIPLSSRLLPMRKTTTIDWIEQKQRKALEMRENFLQDRSIKLQLKTKKEKTQVLAVQNNLAKQSKILKDSIEEKQAKAEKVCGIMTRNLSFLYHILHILQQRDMFIKQIQEKAKEENQKTDEIALLSAKSQENKKIEVAQRHLVFEARLQEIEEERLRKLAEAAAHQEAALERRRSFEVERQAKILREEARRREIKSRLELERKEHTVSKEAARIAKINRVSELKNITETRTIIKHQEFSKRFENKLEKWSIRYNESLARKRERAAIANLNAKVVFENSKKSNGYSPNNATNNLMTLSNFEDVKPFDREKSVKRRVKKLKKNQIQRLRDACVHYEFIPTSVQLPKRTNTMKIAMEMLSDLLKKNNSPRSVIQLDQSLNYLLNELNSDNLLVVESFCSFGGLAVLFNALMLLDDDGNLLLPASSLRLILKSVLRCCASLVNIEYLLLSMDICIEELAELFIRTISFQEYLNPEWLDLSCDLAILLPNLFLREAQDSPTLRKAKADFLWYIFLYCVNQDY